MTADCKCPKCYRNVQMTLPDRLPGETACPVCEAKLRLDVVLIPQRKKPAQPSRTALMQLAA